MLGAYALGRLDQSEARTLDAHLASCAGCRRELAALTATTGRLAEVPTEAFLEGPPDGGELLLRRTLWIVRAARTRGQRQRTVLAAAGLVLVVTLAAGAGLVAGRAWAPGGTEPAQGSTAPGEAAPGTRPPASGVRVAATTDAKSGATINAAVTPAAGWVRVHAVVDGVAPGTRCRLVVVARAGGPVVAGSWLASAPGGTSLDGAALVAAEDVTAVEVVTFDDEKLVSAPF
ncbi:anti-sigma factor [Planosporangium thailandense]|uniref:Anti-sigma factor n=1 Tax=Planosporangium thailandense TaxID=765197 RepID=A0ABX0XXX8_9ACTN|nr:zf-HC2 domain-containing protein [Planosporangium thailandense]NJC70777.1 anti-sigma factor [Planosporangium thailandense]